MTADTGIGTIPVDLGAGVRAFFTTASGGVSPEPWARPGGSGLNLGLNVSDDAGRVRRNRALVGALLGGLPLAFATQVHSARAIPLGPEEHARWRTDTAPDTAGEGDALVTAERGLGLGVLVADCVPVLLADPGAGVVGVAHAGRKGTAAGVVLRALGSMAERGARPDRTRAVVGPAVCGRCYEVPEELRDEVAAVVPGAFAETAWGTPSLDLPAAVGAQLSGAGVDVTRVERCTLEDEEFFSHRRATARGTTTGRQAGIVALV
ncbi:polyphenol oxidase family protein [Myceligenerans salitolerans]|uniref:Laccase domain-containing protein n=1 Tax=Myceligenerans salitolerans TaxID=1230528 RepID=A0ABS3I404_9MICO|nr:polyphenol oxidase family protein [Myceligenerans salitolerans]MBO0607713.1 laccase domain-containing protein [Myceligenerans salitolerans]